ncbi:Fantastic four [Thalictrum thalictroides]|uniref:Fantastic four n=1 Tax=Thalictrum thalictroides TaxID=46969 RepID=A0A7J6X4N5_THATH|nr:Fantastic four [Thalictrum thalictroides]
MSSMVFQGLQSCLEPRFVEPRSLGVKIIATKSHFLKPTKQAESFPLSDTDSDIDENENTNLSNIFMSNDNISDIKDDDAKKDSVNSNTDMGGWSFIQALSKSTCQNLSVEAKNEEKQKTYVHPLYKRSASQLTNKSLELCTETLGSETGSDIGDDIDLSYSSSDSESNKSPTKERSRLRHTFFGCNKKVNYGSLPPPLTSISGSNCYSIKPHREGGRLVMKAVRVPSPNTCFQAERRDGRLKLHYIKNSDHSPYSSDSDQDQDHQEEDDVKHEEIEKDYLNEEIIDETNANAGGVIEMGKIQRPTRCKEGGRGSKGLTMWEPFWVAT